MDNNIHWIDSDANFTNKGNEKITATRINVWVYLRCCFPMQIRRKTHWWSMFGAVEVEALLNFSFAHRHDPDWLVGYRGYSETYRAVSRSFHVDSLQL